MIITGVLCAVYPRWRGEHFTIDSAMELRHGLSPLARGTQVVAVVDGVAVRFIPAGAGNTTISALKIIPRSVYPRWRGEHLLHVIRSPFSPGLSPLARGTLDRNIHTATDSRFIPAGAGNTLELVAERQEIAVYPRWRGEHAEIACSLSKFAGLSPLARGTLTWRLLLRITFRFIPAGAGNTCLSFSVFVVRSVYPRWRGEHFNQERHLTRHVGLSPLARGTPLPVDLRQQIHRFIPAGAGNTYQ